MTLQENKLRQKKFANEDLEIEPTSYIDDKQNVWFREKDVAAIVGYSNSRKALKDHVSEAHKQLICWGNDSLNQQNIDNRNKWCTSIDEAGFYELVFSSKLPAAKKFRDWVLSTVLPSIRKYSQYKLFDSPWNKMIMIGNETALHCKGVNLIRRYYPDSILVAGLGENQDTDDKLLDSYKKGYMRGQPDLMVLDYHKDYKGLCFEFKSPTNNYHVSKAQYELMEKYSNNNYKFMLSNDYDEICIEVHDYMEGVRLPCKYCIRHFHNNDTLETHYRVIHRII